MAWKGIASAFAWFVLGSMFPEDMLGLGPEHPEMYLLPFAVWIAFMAMRALWGAGVWAIGAWHRRGSWCYAVRRGRETGVYACWEDAKLQVEGYSGALHCKFRNRGKALAWVMGNSDAYPPRSVRHSP